MRNLINLFVLSICLCFMAQDVAAQSQSALFKEIYLFTSTQDLNYGCLEYNSTTVRKDSNRKYAYSYTGHGTGSNCNIKGLPGQPNRLSGAFLVEFSDRQWRKGNLDNIKVAFNLVGSSVTGTITLVTWGNAKITLSNIRIQKETQGYFITAKSKDGRSTTYYNFAIYKCHQYN